MRETEKKVLGISLGWRKEDKETCWWNEEVQECVAKKSQVKTVWDMKRDEVRRRVYKKMWKKAKRAVVKVKMEAYNDLY